jgi:hypothetical protein
MSIEDAFRYKIVRYRSVHCRNTRWEFSMKTPRVFYSDASFRPAL